MGGYGKERRRREKRDTPLPAMDPPAPYKPPDRVTWDSKMFQAYDRVNFIYDAAIYNNKAVAFTMGLYLSSEDDDNHRGRCLYRIDCAKPEPNLHVHEFSPESSLSDNTGLKRKLADIPNDGTGRLFVEEQFHICMRKLLDNAAVICERWFAEI